MLPTPEENDALPGTSVTAKKWAKGTLLCGQAFKVAGGYTLDGTLSFRPGVELKVSARGALGSGNSPATFEATGTGWKGQQRERSINSSDGYSLMSRLKTALEGF